MQALNSRGEIQNQTAPEKVAAVYLPLFERVIQAARQRFGDNLHSIYAYGSIAEGRARPGLSDADFVIVLTQTDVQMSKRLEEISQSVLAEFAQLVSKIDLPAGTRDEILAPENLYSWGAYLKILGLPIFGEDLRALLPEFCPSLKMAKAWNEDLGKNIANALSLLASEATDADKQKTIRGISSQAIRSLYLLKVPETQEWTTVFNEQSEKVAAWFPEAADTIRYLAAARNGGKSVSEFRGVLLDFAKSLLVQFEAELASLS